jgi:hypothetical protein
VPWALTRIAKTVAPLREELAELRAEIVELRREQALAKALEEARNQRRIEALEVALIAAGRNPAEIGAEAELPGNFAQWNGGGRAQ